MWPHQKGLPRHLALSRISSRRDTASLTGSPPGRTKGDRVTTVLRFNAAVSNVEFPKRLALFLNRNHARIGH